MPEKEEKDRVAEQLGLRGKLKGTENEFWVNLQREPKTGQWIWNNMTEHVLKYTTSGFGQRAALKGKSVPNPTRESNEVRGPARPPAFRDWGRPEIVRKL